MTKHQPTFTLMLFLLSILAALAFVPVAANAQESTDCAPNALARQLLTNATANEVSPLDCKIPSATTQAAEANLETPDVSPETPDATQETPETQSSEPDATTPTLVFRDDFPLPHDYTNYMYQSNVRDRTGWASSAYDVATLVEFYRRELPPLGWQENDSVIGADKVRLIFKSKYGPLIIELSQAATGGTDIMMTTPVALGVARIPEIVRELPIPTNAVNARVSDNALSFTIVEDPETVVEFYRRELATEEWFQSGFGLHQDESSTMTSYPFYQLDGLHLLLTLTKDTASNTTDEIRVFIKVTGQEPEFPTEEPSHDSPSEALPIPQVPTGDESDDESVEQTGGLQAEDVNGLPMPSDYTDYGYEGSQYRKNHHATAPHDLNTLLEFYRREFSAAGWQEMSDATVIEANRASLLFEGPVGSLQLELNQTASDETEITIIEKNRAKAEADGILPPAGQVRFVFGNINETEVTLTINEQDYNLPPKLNMGKEPVIEDGTFVDLAPGTYTVILSFPSGETFSEEITVDADSTWGLLAGPGGILPLQLY